jgi:hypothetical protein
MITTISPKFYLSNKRLLADGLRVVVGHSLILLALGLFGKKRKEKKRKEKKKDLPGHC